MKKALWCITAFAVLLLIILSSIDKHTEDGKARKVFTKMFGFTLPENAQFDVFQYNTLTGDASFDIVIPDEDVEEVMANVYDFLHLQTNKDISTLKYERAYAQGS